MAKPRVVNKRQKVGSGGGAPAIVQRLVLAAVLRNRLRRGLSAGGGAGAFRVPGLFREVRLAGMPPIASTEVGQGIAHPGYDRGLCAVLPGGLRIEGLDVAGAAALARLLG